MKKRVAILGSTGSIGKSALSVISSLMSMFDVVALSADSNVSELISQARLFRPKAVCINDNSKAIEGLPKGTKILNGPGGLLDIVNRKDVDIVLISIAGTASILPLVEALKNGKDVALASKEALVSAGPMVMDLARKNGAKILPVDSEHSAIFQCISGRPEEISKIYLTGSGGPLLDIPAERFDKLPRSFILNHPKWKMGKKISVDSATMMNKGLEIIEAQYLFDINEKNIEVLIHPEAIIHSMVELSDGTVIAQAAVPDMRLPIQYALTYPARCDSIVNKVDFSAVGRLNFRNVSLSKFPCLGLARYVAERGGTFPAVLCAADEEVVDAYLAGAIKFSSIPKIIEKVLLKHKCSCKHPTIKNILDAQAWAREEARSICCH